MGSVLSARVPPALPAFKTVEFAVPDTSADLSIRPVQKTSHNSQYMVLNPVFRKMEDGTFSLDVVRSGGASSTVKSRQVVPGLYGKPRDEDLRVRFS